MIGDDETNFPYKLLLTNRQVLNLSKVYADKSSTDIKFSKTEISKMIKSGGGGGGGFLEDFLVHYYK